MHELDDWFADEFMKWGQVHLPDVVAEFVDGEAEKIADEAFYEISKDMPRCQMRDRIAFLNQCIVRAEHELMSDVQHRKPFDAAAAVQTRGRKDDPDAIFTNFQQQSAWQDEVRKIQWDILPKDAATPMTDGILAKPIFLVVHLFSGRRRLHDVHWHISKLAHERGIDVAVLSMDTAVSPFYGDLTASSVSWRQLAHLYEQGLIAATLCGAPCETFSAARHVPPPDELPEKEKARWPRPLRTFARLFGLDGLRPKELRQCRQGSAFMLQALMACTWHIVLGGLFLSEHPAPPGDADKASVWTSAFVLLLKKHPDIALQIFDQWRWGAPVRKPTGLFSLRLPHLVRSMFACADKGAKYPTQIAIGKDADGKFKTAVCKEYPPLFAAGMAKAIVDQLYTDRRQFACHRLLSLDSSSLKQWVHEALEASSWIFENSSHLPDYQGM